MADHDLDLDLTPGGPAAPPPGPDDGSGESGRRLVLLAVGVAVVLAAVVGWYWWSSTDVEPATTRAEAGDVQPAETELPALGEGPPADLPPLDELDPTIRTLVGALSSHPQLANLLATDDLVRRFVVSLDRVGRGNSPAAQISVLRPEGAFSVEDPNGESRIRPESFARYDTAVAMVLSLDPDALARIYGQLRPRLNDAYAELGVPDEDFDAVVERAFAHLLSVSPSLARGTVVPVKGTTYGWADSRTENLSPAQKHLLRLGPDHAAAVQAHLREVAQALGIPAERLPSSR